MCYFDPQLKLLLLHYPYNNTNAYKNSFNITSIGIRVIVYNVVLLGTYRLCI